MPTKDKQEFRATPRAPVKGAIADAFSDLHTNYLRKQFGFDNPVTEAISEFLGIPAFAKMMDNLSYGESPFKGKGETLQLKPWAVEGLASLPAGAAAETGLRLVRNLPAAIKHGATEFAKSAGGAGARSHVIRTKGSQTLPNFFERTLQDMKRKTHMGHDPDKALLIYGQKIADAIAQGQLNETGIESAERVLNEIRKQDAINKWIEGPLTKYIKRDMGTPEDPVRKLAEEGIVHTDLPPSYDRVVPQIETERRKAGFSGLGEADSPAARRFENLADESAGIPIRAGAEGAEDYRFLIGGEPPTWFKNLPEDTPVYIPTVYPSDMRLDLVVDALENAVESGAIRPDQLSKVSMSDAVKLAFELEQRKVAQEVERMKQHFPLHKQYQSGFHWVELKANPAKTPDELESTARKKYDEYIGQGMKEKDALEMANAYHQEGLTEAALKREGEAMSHCVGGYCEPVMSGSTRVFSLRDPKGKSHVTVEATKPTVDDVYDDIRYNLSESLERDPTPDELQQALDDYTANSPWSIEQIKGKGNVAPIEDYQPYVADFVRSSPWGPSIGDFQNTDLIKVGNQYLRRREFGDILKQTGYEEPDFNQVPRGISWIDQLMYKNPDTLTEADRELLRSIREFQPPEYKRGGAVKFADGGLASVRAHYFGS